MMISTKGLVREACLAQGVTEDAWLSDLAATCFAPGVIDLLTRWLTLTCTGAINPTDFVLRDHEGVLAPDSLLKSSGHILISILGSSSASSCNVNDPSTTHVGKRRALIWSLPSCRAYNCWVYDEAGEVLGAKVQEEPGSDYDSEYDHGRGHFDSSRRQMLQVDIEMRSGRHIAACIALVHLACKTLASLPLQLEGLYPEGPKRHSLFVQEDPYGEGVECLWSDPRQVPCAQAARALAAMHSWIVKHGGSLPSLSFMLYCTPPTRNRSKRACTLDREIDELAFFPGTGQPSPHYTWLHNR